MMRLLLISNSGQPLLQHCRAEVLDFLRSVRSLGYITAARLDDEDERFRLAAAALSDFGITAEHFRLGDDFKSRLNRAEAVLVSGGNTYALLKRLRNAGALSLLAERVRDGLLYIGTSAGTNIAGPNILATNDWNVVGCNQFDAMGLVPWAINPHYLQQDPNMAPGSETRDQRIGEYLAVNQAPLLAIEEETAVRVEGGRASVVGAGRVRLFCPDAAPMSFTSGQALPDVPLSYSARMVS
jgi:dipeptidase E